MKLKKHLIFLLLLSFFSCQQEKDKSSIDIASLTISNIKDKQVRKLDSIISPADIHIYGKWVVGINLPNSSENIFEFIDGENLEKKTSFLKFGNGNNEFSSCNPFYFESNYPQKFDVNTNDFLISSLHLKNDKLEVIKSEKLLSNGFNNLTKLSQNTFLINSLDSNKHYDVYDASTGKVISTFGDFPAIELSNIEDSSDAHNFLQTRIVFDDKTKQLFAFYVNLPLVRIYKNSELVKEIWTNDDFETDLNKFYDGLTNIYYLKPLLRGDQIFVVYVNKNAESYIEDKEINLLVFDTSGNIIKKYILDESFQSYTISEEGTTFYGIDNESLDNTSILKLEL